MTLSELLKRTREWFAGLSIDTARLDAELLIAHALGIDRITLYTEGTRPLTEDELAACRALVRRRGKREPVAYILGEREFYSRAFAVDPRVLIPRPDTETLVDVALEWIEAPRTGVIVTELDPVGADAAIAPPAQGEAVLGVETVVEYASLQAPPGGEDVDVDADLSGPVALPEEIAPAPRPAAIDHPAEALILDYGTGSGAIAVTLAAERPGLRVLALDSSRDALDVARDNAATHAVADRVGFVCSDGFARLPPRFRGQLAGIVANPPYIALADAPGLAVDVRDHEPPEALFAGPDPLLHYRRIADSAADWLVPQGFVVVEVGFGQARAVAALFGGWREVVIRKDLAGVERVVAARGAARGPTPAR